MLLASPRHRAHISAGNIEAEQESESPLGQRGISDLRRILRPLLGRSGRARGRILASPREIWPLPTCSALSFDISCHRHLPPGRLHYLQFLKYAVKTAPHVHTHSRLEQLYPPRCLYFTPQVSVWRSYLEVLLLCVSRTYLNQSTHHSIVIADSSVFLMILLVPLELTKKVFSPHIPKVNQAFSLHIPRALIQSPQHRSA